MRGPLVLTPHPGEFARLTGEAAPDPDDDDGRAAAAAAAAARVGPGGRPQGRANRGRRSRGRGAAVRRRDAGPRHGGQRRRAGRRDRRLPGRREPRRWSPRPAAWPCTARPACSRPSGSAAPGRWRATWRASFPRRSPSCAASGPDDGGPQPAPRLDRDRPRRRSAPTWPRCVPARPAPRSSRSSRRTRTVTATSPWRARSSPPASSAWPSRRSTRGCACATPASRHRSSCSGASARPRRRSWSRRGSSRSCTTRRSIELLEAAGAEQPIRVHLKVDTGLGRQGAAPDEAVELAARIARKPPARAGRHDEPPRRAGRGRCLHRGPAPATGAGARRDAIGRDRPRARPRQRHRRAPRRRHGRHADAHPARASRSTASSRPGRPACDVDAAARR